MGKVVVQPVQWKNVDDIVEMEPINDNDNAVLDEIRSVILKHGYEERFGVCLVHKHFELEPGEALLEKTDEVARISTINVVSEEIARTAMETAWKFDRNMETTAGRKCTVTCQGSGLTGHSRNHECYKA